MRVNTLSTGDLLKLRNSYNSAAGMRQLLNNIDTSSPVLYDLVTHKIYTVYNEFHQDNKINKIPMVLSAK